MDDLRALADQLRSVNVPETVRPVLSKAGAVMRDRARQEAPAGPHLQDYTRHIVMFRRTDPLSVTVGAQAVGQGNLSAILEYGQGPNAPHPHIVPQLDREAGPAANYIAAAIVKALPS